MPVPLSREVIIMLPVLCYSTVNQLSARVLKKEDIETYLNAHYILARMLEDFSTYLLISTH